MPIDFVTERVVTFREATKLLPRRRHGQKPHISTLYRWAAQGLETIQVGGQRCTSLEALQRFFDRLGHKAGHEPRAPSGRPVKDRSPDRIDRELTALGL